MASVQDKVTRFDADLVDDAAAEGLRQSRSARQQLAHWARLGRAVSNASTYQRVRVEAALAGTLPLSQLGAEESLVVNAEISTAIEERLASVDIAAELATEGVTTVALDEAGNLVEYYPDGTSQILSEG